MDSINKRIKQLRTELGMNQTDFGKKLGIAQTYLSQIEKGDRDVTDKIFKIICLVLWDGKHVNEKWLETGDGDMFEKQSKDIEISSLLADVENMDNSNFKKRLISALARLDDKGWNELEKFIDSISEKK